MDDLSRRELLGIAGGGLVAGGAGYLLLPDSGDTPRRAYESWVPAAQGRIESVRYWDISSLRANRAFLPFELSETDFEQDLNLFNTEDIEWEITSMADFLQGGMYFGSFEAAKIADHMDQEWSWASRRGTYEGYHIVGKDDYRWAIGNDAVIRENLENTLETIIDTKQGETTRAVEATTGFARLVDEIGTGSGIYVESLGQSFQDTTPSGLRGGGSNVTVEGRSTSFTIAYLLDHEPSDEDVSAVRDEVERYAVTGVSTSVGDQLVTVSGRFDTADLSFSHLYGEYSLQRELPLPGGPSR